MNGFEFNSKYSKKKADTSYNYFLYSIYFFKQIVEQAYPKLVIKSINAKSLNIAI